jgi:hypothetical protein
VEDDPVELAESVYLSIFIWGIEPNAFDGLLMLIDMTPDGSDMAIVSPPKNMVASCSMGRLVSS